MTDLTTADSGAGAVAPAAPKSDAEAALQTQQAPATPEPTDEQKAAAEKADAERKEGEERKKNRTRSYIDRIQQENAELRRRLADQSSQPPTQHRAPDQQPPGDKAPTIADYGYDFDAYQQARDAWVLAQAEQRFQQRTQQQAQQAREQQTWQTYETKAAEFANDHEDFYEVVGSMPPLPLELQAAIAAHPNGPAIAYHLGNTPSDLLAFANTNPQYAGLALQQIAARLGAAPAASQPIAAPAALAPTKPITQAPPPVPTVGGRSATETPEHKLTDDQWLERERERERARRGR